MDGEMADEGLAAGGAVVDRLLPLTGTRQASSPPPSLLPLFHPPPVHTSLSSVSLWEFSDPVCSSSSSSSSSGVIFTY